MFIQIQFMRNSKIYIALFILVFYGSCEKPIAELEESPEEKKEITVVHDTTLIGQWKLNWVVYQDFTEEDFSTDEHALLWLQEDGRYNEYFSSFDYKDSVDYVYERYGTYRSTKDSIVFAVLGTKRVYSDTVIEFGGNEHSTEFPFEISKFTSDTLEYRDTRGWEQDLIFHYTKMNSIPN